MSIANSIAAKNLFANIALAYFIYAFLRSILLPTFPWLALSGAVSYLLT